jgi:hypothetical protein
MIEFIEPVMLLVVALVARSVAAEARGNERSHSDANNARWRCSIHMSISSLFNRLLAG